MVIEDENTVTTSEFKAAVRDEQPALQFPDGTDGALLLTVLKRQMDRLDMEIDELDKQRDVETAVGEHLERLGVKYQIERKTGESDRKLRLRIKAARNAARSRGTFQDVGQVALDVLDCSASDINLQRASGTTDMGTAVIEVAGQVLDDSPFSTSEIANIIGDATIGGHRIEIQQSDAFTFGDADNGFGTEWGQTVQ